MTDPVTTIAAGAVLKIAFDEFIKSSSGEAAKKITGEALSKVNELRKVIWNYFTKNKKQNAIEAITEIEKTGSEKALGKLEVYLEEAMKDEAFAKNLYLLANEIKMLRTAKMVMASGLDLEGNLEAEELIQKASLDKGSIEQSLLTDINAKDIKIGSASQEINYGV